MTRDELAYLDLCEAVAWAGFRLWWERWAFLSLV